MSRQKAIDRIQKLLRLSNSVNEHEAALAAESAATLMLEYQIDQACIEGTVIETIVEHTLETGKRVVAWKGSIANGVAQAYGCRMFWHSANIVIVGHESNVAAIRYTYQYLIREIAKLTEHAWKQTQTFESARRWKHAFRVGAAQTIKHRLIGTRSRNISQQQSGAKSTADKEALVRIRNADQVVDTYFEDLSRDFRNVRSSASSHWGFASGVQAGQGVLLDSGAALTAPPLRLKGK